MALSITSAINAATVRLPAIYYCSYYLDEKDVCSITKAPPAFNLALVLSLSIFCPVLVVLFAITCYLYVRKPKGKSKTEKEGTSYFVNYAV